MSLRARHRIGMVLVDTQLPALAHNALVNSLAKFPADDVLVFSDQPQLWSRYRHVLIDRITDIEDYNRIILTSLAEHAVCDFQLIIQYDGFVLNGDAFIDEFLEHDYVGAVWPNFSFHNVGNGGFSLRSRRLIEEAARLSHLRLEGEAEDLFICRSVRPLLEGRAGVRFASPALAHRFAFESPGQSLATFGFHGFLNLPIIYRDDPSYLLGHLPTALIRRRQGEILFGCTNLLEPQRSRWLEELSRRLTQS